MLTKQAETQHGNKIVWEYATVCTCVFAGCSTVQIAANLNAAELQSLLGDRFFSPLSGEDKIQLHPSNPSKTMTTKKQNKPKKTKQKTQKNKPPETAAPSISYLMPCGVSPRAEKQLLFLLERRITTSLK